MRRPRLSEATNRKSRLERGTTTQDTLDVALLERTFAAVTPMSDVLVTRFYTELFQRHPEVKSLFNDTDRNRRGQEFLGALQLLVGNLRNPDALTDALHRQGEKLQAYGARPEHYRSVAETLLDVMEQVAGEHWSDAARKHWEKALKRAAAIMLSAYRSAPPTITEETMQLFLGVNSMWKLAGLLAAPLAGLGYLGFASATQSGLVVAAMAGVVTLAVGLGLLRAWSRSLAAATAAVEAITGTEPSVDLATPVPVLGHDHVSQLFRAIESLRSTLEEERTANNGKLVEARRLNRALDKAAANVMVADADLDIIYLNESADALMRHAQSDIRADFPNFNASGLVGATIDVFDKSAPRLRGLLQDLRETSSMALELGGRTFTIIANPIVDEGTGERLGTVVEWVDRTQEVAVEGEVEGIVNAAKAGDLTQRIVLEGKRGFFQSLSGGVNDLVEVAENVLKDTGRVLGAMSDGDLTQTIQTDYQGSFGQLKADANATVEKLTAVVMQIKSATDSVATGASEIAQGNSDLSSRTEQQASSLEETASSMEEMTSTVKQNADSAQQANQLAASAREQAETGGEVVGQAVAVMAEINDSSRKIADIIGVIDEIAFQTNLLALNASVEAARAGDQGRGFAVVASEVRNLAGRSATAAKEIKELIEDSVSKVSEGARLVNESGETLGEIVTSVKKVTDIVAEIAAASREQSSGIEQVSRAVMQMDETTQQNAALVEQAASASASMGSQANRMQELASFFKVGDVPEQGVVGVERRSAARPWSEVPAAPAPPAAPAARATASRSDPDWEEF